MFSNCTQHEQTSKQIGTTQSKTKHNIDTANLSITHSSIQINDPHRPKLFDFLEIN